MDTNALVTNPAGKLAEPMGKPKGWARDFALIGGMTGLAAPLAVAPMFVGTGYIAAAAVTGALSGAGLGLVIPKMLGRLGNVRLPVLLFGGLGVGAVWGGIVGASASLFAEPNLLWFSIPLAGIAGAIQFGWIWLPYVLKQIGKRKTWSLVLASMAVAPALGWAAIWVFAMLASVLEMIF